MKHPEISTCDVRSVAGIGAGGLLTDHPAVVDAQPSVLVPVVVGASEALWYEVRPWGICVTLIEPGFIHSDSFQHTRYTRQSAISAEDPLDPYYAHYQSMSGFIAKIMSLTWSSPERVARTIVRQLRRKSPPLRVYATLDAHLFALMRRLLPRAIYHEVLYRFLPRIRTWGPDWEDRRLPAYPVGDSPSRL